MKGRELLGRAVEVVTFLVAMFGGFLKKVAPPEETDAGFAVGLGSFMALVILLLVSVRARGRFSARRRTVWTAMAAGLAVVALISGLLYQRNFGRLTFLYPSDSQDAVRLVRGTDYTREAQAYAARGMNAGQILAQFNPENIDQVWPPEAIADAKTILTVNYLILVLALAGTIFSLVEIYLAGETSSEAGASKTPAQMELTSLALWQEKLGFLKEQEAIVSDPAQKYTLKKQIEEAEEMIRELTAVEPA